MPAGGGSSSGGAVVVVGGSAGAVVVVGGSPGAVVVVGGFAGVVVGAEVGCGSADPLGPGDGVTVTVAEGRLPGFQGRFGRLGWSTPVSSGLADGSPS
ncbi:hypothetical protein GA0074696_3148 [Micromonospora purpureochromogenes]|uniref:Uncharacterized protein n=1 Tax=Micromonospora purpureochromogenes TaxID=47872 RepID=A0A1C4Y958_9ACTN|nr:hypothetical protein GA0074696_3148 [Micromonospora purpureochromogenes]